MKPGERIAELVETRNMTRSLFEPSRRRLDQCADVLSVQEAADFFGVSLGRMRAAIADRQIRSFRIGRRVLVPRAALESIINAESEIR